MSAEYVWRDTSDNPVSTLAFAGNAPGITTSVIVRRLYNAGTTASATLEIGCLTVTGCISGERNSQGQELVTEQWLQASVSANPYTPIGGNLLLVANTLSITPPNEGAYLDVSFKAVIPAGVASRGGVLFIPLALYKP